jgi:hypothetical protein
MLEETNIILCQRRQNGCRKLSIYTLKLLPNIWNRLRNRCIYLVFCHTQQSYSSRVTSFGLFTGHHQTYVQEHMKETMHMTEHLLNTSIDLSTTGVWHLEMTNRRKLRKLRWSLVSLYLCVCVCVCVCVRPSVPRCAAGSLPGLARVSV